MSLLNGFRVVKIFFLLLSFLSVVSVFVPFSPSMPGVGLDPSWVFGMNQAMQQGLTVGSDIIFTFGPYASIYTRQYQLATDALMIGGGIYIAIIYCVCLVLIAGMQRWAWIFIFSGLLASVMYSPDSILFTVPLMVGLAVNKCVIPSGSDAGEKIKYFLIFLIFSVFGFLPLIKGSLLLLCGATAFLSAFYLWLSKRTAMAVLCMVSPVISLPLFWVVSGQPIFGLPSYFVGMVPIISGYTEAMSVLGDVKEIFAFLVSSCSLLLFVFFGLKKNIINALFVSCLYLLFLFIAFKAGFVRHDAHAKIASTSLLLAAFSMPLILGRWQAALVITIALASWSYIDRHYGAGTPGQIAGNIEKVYRSTWSGLKLRASSELEIRYASKLEIIRGKDNFPKLAGRVDIYSYNQSNLIASGNQWSPRPIFQSYSVYMPSLAELNKEFISGNSAPENIIFKVEPIDKRLPSIEDGASWPALLNYYHPFKFENDFLYLKKHESKRLSNNLQFVRSEKHNLTERVELPSSKDPLFAYIEVKKNFLGSFINILFKPSQLYIDVTLKDGAKHRYRIVSGMVKSGFLISPLIRGTSDFGMLYGDKALLDANIVRDFTISADGRIPMWAEEYNISFSKIIPAQAANIGRLYGFQVFDDALSNSNQRGFGICAGSIDSINNVGPLPAVIRSGNYIKIHGWLTDSTDNPAEIEAIYVVFTDGFGKLNFLNTKMTPRPDVGAYFKNNALNNSGFSARANISKLSGRYSLGLAMKIAGEVKLCPQFNIQVQANE